MWYLEAYDSKTELISDSYPLRNITGNIIKGLIEVDESEMPLEWGPYPVALADLTKFKEYIGGGFTVDNNCSYFVGLFAD